MRALNIICVTNYEKIIIIIIMFCCLFVYGVHQSYIMYAIAYCMYMYIFANHNYMLTLKAFCLNTKKKKLNIK